MASINAGRINILSTGVYAAKDTEKPISMKKGLDDYRLTLLYLAPRDGLEPPTGWLTATCSTD